MRIGFKTLMAATPARTLAGGAGVRCCSADINGLAGDGRRGRILLGHADGLPGRLSVLTLDWKKTV
jgi:hypothetical protein